VSVLSPPPLPSLTSHPGARWQVAAAAVLVHLCIGSVYAYSVFQEPLHALHGWSKQQVTLAFSLAIVFLGLTAATGGATMRRLGPRRCALLAAAGWGGGLALAGLGVWLGWLWLFWLGYGVIGGIGLGLGYAPPVTALILWFPDRRGLATGMAVCGFGFAAMIAAPAANALMNHLGAPRTGVPLTFVVLGLGYGVAILFASLGLRMPASAAAVAAGKPGFGNPGAVNPGARPIAGSMDATQLTAHQAVRTARFWLLWTMFFLNICAGITLISLASPMGQDVYHLTPAQAAVLVGLIGIANGAGRLGWSTASDFLGRPATYILMFALQLTLFAVLPAVASAGAFEACLVVILTCYGAGFAVGPAFLADMFGTRHAGAIYGLLLTAWSAAGLAGPQLGALLRQTTGSYTGVLRAITVGLGVALILAVVLSVILKRNRQAGAR
jgi:MFS transporter, OFA family, oxalate/formate antiporter